VTPAAVGNLQAYEAVKRLLDRPAMASGVALHLDWRPWTWSGWS